MIYDEVEWSSGLQDVDPDYFTINGLGSFSTQCGWSLSLAVATDPNHGYDPGQRTDFCSSSISAKRSSDIDRYYYNYINRYNRVDEENLEKDYLLIEGSWEMCSRV